MELQEYLNTQYRQDCERQDDILSLMRQVLPLFLKKYNKEEGWPYECSEEATLSSSTIAMTADALQHVINADIPEIIFNNCQWEEEIFGGKKELKGRDAIEAVLKAATNLVIGQEGGDVKSNEYFSNTYGKNSVYVLTWICELLIQQGKTAFPERIQQLAKDRIGTILPQINHLDDIEFYEQNSNKNSPEPEYDKSHAFPLLKALQLYELGKLCNPKLVNYGSPEENILEDHLLKKLHYCISLASMENSQFDAAELVFSLEGLLITRTLRLGSGEKQKEEIAPFLCETELLEKVFSILAEKQRVNRYWRPLRPFITNAQGFALLPISSEIAQSLLRICKRLGRDGNRMFANYSAIFECYFDWIKSKFKATNEVCGWCSEHIYNANKIHIWQSSQVLLFLTDYYGFLRQKIADDALRAANLSVKQPKENNKDLIDFWKTTPYGSHKVNEFIEKIVIESKDQSASFLLYGPPGTGKTTFAEKISSLKKWPLLSLSPSDFIADGVDKVEAKAKNLFKVLCAQHNMVIIFDEIDRLMLNRDSEDYRAQNDMFQLLVPSLLVKFKELRETPHIIFLVCTNYKCRLDPAVIRPGRIDHHILVLPPDETGRVSLLKEVVEANGIKLCTNEIIASDIEALAISTPLYSYGELIQLAKEYANRIKVALEHDKGGATIHSDMLIELIENRSSTITLETYLRSIDSEESRPAEELPLDEIFMIAYVLYEAIEAAYKCTANESTDEEEHHFWNQLITESKLQLKSEKLRCLLSKKEYSGEGLKRVGIAMGEEVKNKVEAMIREICSWEE